MIILGKYEELVPGMGFPSMKKHISNEPYETKAMVLKHLRSGKIHMTSASKIVDALSGEGTNLELVFMNDGKYSWSSKIPYYVEKYNLRLDKEFEEYILSLN